MKRRGLALAGAFAALAGSAWAGGAAVHPSGPVVPENLLRIELELASPLRAPLDMAHVRLLDAAGQEIPDAFLDLPLPGADGRRVALLLHPARVKTGVGANRALGRALQPGTEVTLLIDDPAIGPALRKTWQVVAFDAGRPTPARWTFAPPQAGTRQPLLVHLDRPLGLAATAWVAVQAPDGRRVAGHAVLEDGDTAWRFTPAQPWQAGRHVLLTHPELETPAGNRACAAFEQRAAHEAACDNGTATRFEIRR